MKKILTILLAIAIFVSMFVGCTKKTPQPTGSAAPVQGGKLTYWAPFENYATKSVSNYTDLPMYKELQKRLGITLEFLHPPTGMERDQFKLLVASKALPDIIEYDWFTEYPKGPQKALDDGVIIDLTKYIKDGKTPNLSKVLASDPIFDGTVKTYAGNYYVFPSIRAQDLMNQKGGGITVRKDILDSLNLKVPTTIDEWYTALTAMKKSGIAYPFTGDIVTVQKNDQSFVGAFGIGYDFYQIDGKIMYGQIEPGYKDYLTTMNKWFKEGLIDPDIYTNTNSILDTKMTSGKSVVTDRSPDSGIGVWTATMRKTDPKVTFVAAPFPTLKKGEKRYFSAPNQRYQATFSAAISSTCKNVDLAIKLLDYGYSEEGKLLYNFGIQGQSFEMVNGQPEFTPLITKNPNGLVLKEAMILYCRNTAGGPFEKALGPILSQRTYQEQKDAPILWNDSVDWSRSLPRLVYSSDEASEFADIMSEVNVLSEEMSIKLTTGDKPISAYDTYVESIKKAKIARAIEIVQTAFTRQSKK